MDENDSLYFRQSSLLRKQRSFNRSTVMVATVMTVNMLIQDLEIRSMRDEIGNLKNEIKELRKTEGD